MKFITFQPLHVLQELNTKRVCLSTSSNRLNNSIFCLAVNENTMERLFICAPSMPQVAIIFETDEYDEIDSITWVNKLFLDEEISINSKYKEYTVKRIKLSNVISTQIISESNDPNEVQDDFLNTHFESLAKLSGKRWYRLGDRPDFFETESVQELIENIMLCMMPYRVVTEEDYDNTIDLIRKYFIKHI